MRRAGKCLKHAWQSATGTGIEKHWLNGTHSNGVAPPVTPVLSLLRLNDKSIAEHMSALVKCVVLQALPSHTGVYSYFA